MKERTDEQYYDDEIDLAQLMFVLWKRKMLILIITCFIVIIAGVVTLRLPKIYNIYTVIEPGIVDITQEGRFIYIDNPDNIKARIDSQVYTQRLLKTINPDRNLFNLDFKVNIPNKTNIIKISYEIEKAYIGFGLQAIEELINELRKDYSTEIQLKKDEYSKQIIMKNNQITALNQQKKDIEKQILKKDNIVNDNYAQIEFYKANLKAYDKKIDSLLVELKSIKAKSQDVLMQNGELFKDQSTQHENKQAGILYSANIQQSMSLFQELRYQISDLRIEKEFSRSAIKTLEQDINDLYSYIETIKREKILTIQSDIDTLQSEMDNLKNKLNYIQEIKIISEPVSSQNPIKPKVKVSMIFALIAGFFFSVFAAFIAEYVSNLWKKTLNPDIES